MFFLSIEVVETQQVPISLQLKLSLFPFISIFADMEKDQCLIDSGKLNIAETYVL